MFWALLHHHQFTEYVSYGWMTCEFAWEYDSMNQGVMGNWSHGNGIRSCISRRLGLYKESMSTFWFFDIDRYLHHNSLTNSTLIYFSKRHGRALLPYLKRVDIAASHQATVS